MVVTSGCQNFQNAVADIQNGYIEGTAAKVINHDLLLGFLINAVSQCSSGRLVDDTQNFQTCDFTSVLGCLTLRVSEVCRNGDDSLSNRRTDISLCVSLQLLQNHCRDLLGRILLVVDGNTVIRAHVTLDRADGAVSVGNSLALCNLANHALAGLGESDNRRGGTSAFSVCDNSRLAAFHNGDAAVGGT